MASKKETPAAIEAPVLARGERLVGDALLAYVDEHKGIAERDLVRGAGYWREQVKKDTGEVYVQLNANPFYKALAAAKQLIELPVPAPGGGGGGGDRRRFRVRTNPKTGNAVVTGGYLAEAGITPGQYVRIEVTEANEIVLVLDEDQTATRPQACEAPGQLHIEDAMPEPEEEEEEEYEAA